MKQSREFIAEQIRTLSALGYSEADIARTLRWVEAHLPPDADPATWVPSAADLSEDLLTNDGVDDAIAAWVKARSVPKQYKAIIDAASEEL